MYDEKDTPWMPDEIRLSIKMKNDAWKEYVGLGIKQDHYAYLEDLTN